MCMVSTCKNKDIFYSGDQREQAFLFKTAHDNCAGSPEGLPRDVAHPAAEGSPGEQVSCRLLELAATGRMTLGQPRRRYGQVFGEPAGSRPLTDGGSRRSWRSAQPASARAVAISVFGVNAVTASAFLGSILWINFKDYFSSSFCFVASKNLSLIPCSI